MAKKAKSWQSPRDFEGKDDASILKQVLADFQKASAFVAQYEAQFRKYYRMYRSKLTDEEKREYGSNLFIPYTFQNIETIVPKIVLAQLYQRPYVQVLPLGVQDDKARAEKAEAMNDLLDYQFHNKINFVDFVTKAVKNAATYGTAITKHTWDYEVRNVIKREPRKVLGMKTGNYDEVTAEEVVKNHPALQIVPLLDFFPDSTSDSLEKARYCIHRYYKDINDLREAADKYDAYKNLDQLDGDYEDSTASSMLSEVGLSADKKGIEVLEYWTNSWRVRVANRSVVISVDRNPYYHQKMPFAKWDDTPVAGEFYSIGLAEAISDLQAELNTTRNQRIDNVSFTLNRMWKIRRGSDVREEDLVSRPNGFIEVDEMDDVEEITFPDVTASAYNEEGVIKEDMDKTSGVFDAVRGSTPARRETATTTSILANAGSERFNLKNMLIAEGGMKECLNQVIRLNQQYVDEPVETPNMGADGTVTVGRVTPEDIVGEYDIVAVGSATEPSLNKEYKQSQLTQLVNVIAENPYVNQKELLKRVFEVFEMKNIDMLLQDPAPEAPPEEDPMADPMADPMMAQAMMGGDGLV